MTIQRYMVVDPNPSKKQMESSNGDVLVYQIPGNSNEEKLFIHMLEECGIDYVVIEGKPNHPPRKRKK